MKRIAYILTAIVVLNCCSGAARKSPREPQFYSGIFTVDLSGEASFTDCATRITMHLDTGGKYEELRDIYSRPEEGRAESLHIEFYGALTDGAQPGDASHGGNPSVPGAAVPVVRMDSLLTVGPGGDCPSDFLVPGLYRGTVDGQVRILRLRPLYTYSLELPEPSSPGTLSEGRWYRTSIVTIVLEDKDTGMGVPYQIVPAQETIARIDGDRSEVYVRQWL